MNFKKTTLLFILVLLGLWSGGFFLYISQIQNYPKTTTQADAPESEAIVVLTGGSDRLEEGLKLLQAGKGKKLLISGVAHGVTLKQVLLKYEVSDDLKSCCIILGYAADNTIGNAKEAHDWMETEGFKSITLVTAHYHMPRSMLFFQKSLPEAQIIPYPVSPDSVVLDTWWQHWGTASLLVMEYNKYLYAKMHMI